MPELQASLPQKRVGIAEFSDKLSDFYMTQWQPAVKKGYKGPSMVFLVAGFDEGAPYGRLFMLELPTKPKPAEQVVREVFQLCAQQGWSTTRIAADLNARRIPTAYANAGREIVGGDTVPSRHGTATASS